MTSEQPTDSPLTDAALSDAADLLRYEHGTSVDVEDRTLRLAKVVNGDPGLAVLRVLGLAHAASPVGAAARSPHGVAVGVWRAPELYLARWTNGKRWVVGYRVTGSSTVSDYVGMEGRVPTRMETGHWYGQVPDEVNDAFLDAGILLDDPPFPVPAPSPIAAPSKKAAKRAPAGGAAPRASAPRAVARAERTPATRVCPSCRMHKAHAQFVAGSELCVDCR